MAATPITSLINSGMDAFSNLYDVIVTPPGAITERYSSEGFSIRATDFSPPELTHGTYTADYKVIQLTRPNSTIDGERKFQITFRMDASFDLYKALLAWKKVYINPMGDGSINFGSLSGQGNPTPKDLIAENYGSVKVNAYKANGASEEISGVQSESGVIWTFNDVLCTKVGSPAFSRDGTDAATVTAEFIFGRYTLEFAAAS